MPDLRDFPLLIIFQWINIVLLIGLVVLVGLGIAALIKYLKKK